MSRDETADFPGCTVVGDSGKTLMIKVPLNKDGTKTKTVSIPKSQIDDDSEVYDADKNSTGKLIIPMWLAEDRGLI